MGTRSFPITQKQARFLMDGLSALKAREGMITTDEDTKTYLDLWNRLTDIGYPKPEPVLLKPMPPELKMLAKMSPDEVYAYLKEKEKVKR